MFSFFKIRIETATQVVLYVYIYRDKYIWTHTYIHIQCFSYRGSIMLMMLSFTKIKSPPPQKRPLTGRCVLPSKKKMGEYGCCLLFVFNFKK